MVQESTGPVEGFGEGHDVLFPVDSGVIDVTRPPYGARGDGVTDDTPALLKALHAFPNGKAIIYLPNGTYRVSDTLTWPRTNDADREKNTILQGQSTAGTIIRLADSCRGFTNPNQPKAVIRTGTAPAQRFRNAVRTLTIDTGTGNAGAVGAQFMANNQGCMRDVVIRSGDGTGVIGLDMSYSDEIGPLLIKNLRVTGFCIGVKTAYCVDSMTLEHIVLENQREYGFYNWGQCVSIRGLRSLNSVPAVFNGAETGCLCLVDAHLAGSGPARDAAAIVNNAVLFARNIQTSGYARVIQSPSAPAIETEAGLVSEYVSHPPFSLFDSPGHSLNLPIKETPDVPWDALEGWISPTHFGLVADGTTDATEAIQRAVDSGKTTVYFPRGNYLVTGTVLLRGNVRRIIGCEACIDAQGTNGPAFRIVDGHEPVVVFERLQGSYSPRLFLENASSRTLVIRDCCDVCGDMTGSGEIFIEDVCSNPFTNWQFRGQRVWARQFNPENQGTHVVNNGGDLWILGLKTERGGVLVETINNGRTEILGGFFYATTKENSAPAFVSRDSSVSITAGEACFNRHPFMTLVEESRGADIRSLRRGGLPVRTEGSVIPLYCGF